MTSRILFPFFSMTLLSCGPKIADKETAQVYEKSIFTIIAPFTNTTDELYGLSMEIFKLTEITKGKISPSDSLLLFTKHQKCDSTIDVALRKLSAINEPEEIINYDKGQLKKLITKFALESKRQINGPLYKLLKLYSADRAKNFDSLKISYTNEYLKQEETLKSVTQEIYKLPYYQND